MKFYSITLSVGWLPGSVNLPEAAKAAIVTARGSSEKSIRGSYSILGSLNNPLIKEGLALRRRIHLLLEQFTLPEYCVLAASNSENPEAAKIRGARLIAESKLEEFLSLFNAARTDYLLWGERITQEDNYEMLRELDQSALGQDWETVSQRYPTREDLRESISCDTPQLKEVCVDFSTSNLPKYIQDQLREMATNQIETTIENATLELVSNFRTMVSQISRNCGPRQRVQEVPGRPDLRQAEILESTTNEVDEEVPEGHVMVRLQPSKEKDGKLVQNGKPEVVLMTKAEFSVCQPYNTTEKRVLTRAGIENLMLLIDKIKNVKDILREENSTSIDSVLSEVIQHVSMLGRDSETVSNTLASSTAMRQHTGEVFSQLTKTLQETETCLKQNIRVKKRVVRSASSLTATES